MTKKSNQVIYCTPEEKEWLKEQLENYRLGVTDDSTNSIVNSITMAKQEILEAIRSTSTTNQSSNTSATKANPFKGKRRVNSHD